MAKNVINGCCECHESFQINKIKVLRLKVWSVDKLYKNIIHVNKVNTVFFFIIFRKLSLHIYWIMKGNKCHMLNVMQMSGIISIRIMIYPMHSSKRILVKCSLSNVMVRILNLNRKYKCWAKIRILYNSRWIMTYEWQEILCKRNSYVQFLVT